jgi:hypothetical protein
VIIHVYVCPTPGCQDYYGSGDMGDLAASRQGHRGGNFEHRPLPVHHTRADCPTCRALGLGRVERVRVAVNIDRPQPVKPVELEAISSIFGE